MINLGNILITNDDGYNNDGILLLERLSQKYGNVFSVSPLVEQSAKSHSINIRSGIKLEKINENKYAFDSTPADCVRYVYYNKVFDFDIVFSGINSGFNCGEDIMYSGTVSAVVEGGFMNKKGISFSSKPKDPSVYEVWFDRVIEYIVENDLLNKYNLLNVNIPENPKGIMHTYEGHTNFNTYYELVDGLYYQMGDSHFEDETDKLTDTYAIYNNYISISQLVINKTSKDFVIKK